MMDEVYVRKDVLNETLQRIEAKADAGEARIHRQVDRVLHQFERDTNLLADNFLAVKENLENMEHRLDRFITTATIWLGLVTLIFAAVPVYLLLRS